MSKQNLKQTKKNNMSKQNLKQTKKNILAAIKEYNKIAKDINFDSRIALIEAEAFFENNLTKEEIENGLEERPKNINKYFKENGPYDAPIDYNITDNTCWFPSSICIGY